MRNQEAMRPIWELAFKIFCFILVLIDDRTALSFGIGNARPRCNPRFASHAEHSQIVSSVEEATSILTEWDRNYNKDSTLSTWNSPLNLDDAHKKLPEAIKLLNAVAAEERSRDSTQGRVLLGICASTADEGLAALKSWVSALELPRGLLHGMDKDGVPLQIEGSVYLKYNTGGSQTFSNIRKIGIGFDAIWKPGDVLLEMYDGSYRGVYFQVELSDGAFRQYLVPLDVFER